MEHSAILSTFIKLPFVIKIFVLSIFEWLFYTCFTQVLLYIPCHDKSHLNYQMPRFHILCISHSCIPLIFIWFTPVFQIKQLLKLVPGLPSSCQDHLRLCLVPKWMEKVAILTDR